MFAARKAQEAVAAMGEMAQPAAALVAAGSDAVAASDKEDDEALYRMDDFGGA